MSLDVFCGFSGAAGSYLLALTQSAEKEYGISSKHLLQMCSLCPDSFGSDYRIIPAFYVSNVITHVVNITGDELVGLKLAQHLNLKAFDSLGYLLMHCESIGEGLEQIIRFEKLVMEQSVTTISEHDDQIQVSWSCHYDIPSLPYFRELIVSGWVAMVNNMTKRQFPLKCVHFAHKFPFEGTEKEAKIIKLYESLYGCPVTFDSGWNGVSFDKKYMNLPFTKSDSRLKGIMEEYAELMLATLDSQLSFVHQAKLTIYKQLMNGETDFESFAQLMHLSTRALQARFQKIGVTYGDLLDEIRRILSLLYLNDPSISTLEVGNLLAYTDQSSFAKAFKRWTGKTPKQYKEKLQHHKLKYSQCREH